MFQTVEAELKQFFSAFGAVKDAKIIADRAGVSKGYELKIFCNIITLICSSICACLHISVKDQWQEI